jgi:hypothetical protein
MARPINAGFTPAQIIQQYEYYQYPVQQLVASLGAKEQQQEKAIESLSSFDSELGKYNALPGDEANKQKVLTDYNTLKDVTSNQDLTNKTGRKALMDFKTSLTSDIFPKLTKYNASAEKFKENYKQETEKLAKGEGSTYTLARLNDMATSWNSDANGVFTGLQRGKYMDFATYIKDKHPDLLKGGWDPTTIGSWTKLFDNQADDIYQTAELKSISKNDIVNAYNGYKSYLASQGYLEDVTYNIQKYFTPEEATQEAARILVAKTNDDFEVLKNQAASYSGDANSATILSKNLGIPVDVAQKFLAGKGKDESANEAVKTLISEGLSKKLTQLTPILGYQTLTDEHLMQRELMPVIGTYAGKITDVNTKTLTVEDWIFKTNYKSKLDRDNALAVAAATKPIEDKALTSYEYMYELPENQARNYVVNEGWNNFNEYSTLSFEINKLSNKQNRTELENSKLERFKERFATLSAEAKDYYDNVLATSKVPTVEVRTIINKLSDALGSSLSHPRAQELISKHLGDVKQMLNSRKDGINMAILVYGLNALKNNIDSKYSGLINSFIEGSDGILQAYAVNNPTLVKTKRATVIGKSKAYDDFRDRLTIVFDGNKQHELDESEKKAMVITEDGKVIIPGKAQYTLTDYDLNNLYAATDKTLSAQEATSVTQGEQENAIYSRVTRAYKPIYNVVSRNFVEPVSKITNTLIYSDARNEYYMYREPGNNLATLKFKPKGTNTYQKLFTDNTSYGDSKALLIDFYRTVLQPK